MGRSRARTQRPSAWAHRALERGEDALRRGVVSWAGWPQDGVGRLLPPEGCLGHGPEQTPRGPEGCPSPGMACRSSRWPCSPPSAPRTHLLIEAAADGAPANLHEPLGGDEHLVEPLPWNKPRQAWQVSQDCLLPQTRPQQSAVSPLYTHVVERIVPKLLCPITWGKGRDGEPLLRHTGRLPKGEGPHPQLSWWWCLPVLANTALSLDRVGGPRPVSGGVLGQEHDGRGSWLCWEELGARVPSGRFQGCVRRAWGLRTQ